MYKTDPCEVYPTCSLCVAMQVTEENIQKGEGNMGYKVCILKRDVFFFIKV